MSDKLENRLQQLGSSAFELNPVLAQNPQYCLTLQQDKLSIFHKTDKHYINVDFASKHLSYRSQAHLQAELIVKAVLGKKKQALKILDCTAGFGKDAYILSLTGSSIIAFESHALMFLLLKDGLQRAKIDTINLQNKNALKAIKNTVCDVVYIDPMYPASKKTAKNNKFMTFLQAFIGHQDTMALKLFEQARLSAAKKIVIKRPIKANFVNDSKPSSQIIGKAVRFDIYAQ